MEKWLWRVDSVPYPFVQEASLALSAIIRENIGPLARDRLRAVFIFHLSWVFAIGI